MIEKFDLFSLIFSPSRPKEVTVYNCTSGNVNPVTWGFFGKTGVASLKKYPFDEIFRRPNFAFEPNK